MEKGKSTVFSKFSPDGGFIAIADGTQVVTVWDYSSSKQVSRISKPDWAEVRSLAWSPQKVGRKRKKRNTLGLEKGPTFLAVGGTHGVSLWNVKQSEEQYATSIEGLNSVISVAWGTNDLLFFTDGSQSVTQWNTSDNTMERWKCDKRSVCCVCVNSDCTILATAGRSIKTWNISDHSVLKKFSGHISNVIDLSFLTSSIISTVAENDRTVCIWDIESDENISLICESSAQMVTSSLHGEQVNVGVVCAESLHTYTIDSVIDQDAKPLRPITTIQIKSKTSSQLLPILSATMDSSSNEILLVHTSHIKPSFESVSWKQEDTRVCLERIVPKGILLPDEMSSSKAAPPSTKQQANPVVTTGAPMVRWGDKPRTDKENKDNDDNDVPMAERLKALGIGSMKQEKKVHATAESLSILVVQSVHSGDKKMLEEVLREEKLANATVRNLPITAVVPFLKTLVELLQTTPSRGPVLSLWIKSVLLLHTAYLLTVPHLLNSLSTLYQSMESRSTTYTKLNRLKGKLDLLLAQSSDVAGGNGLSHQLQLLNKPLLSITAGSDALLDHDNGSDEEYDATLFQSSEEDEEGADSGSVDYDEDNNMSHEEELEEDMEED